MANQKITEVGEVNSLNFSDNIFVNSSKVTLDVYVDVEGRWK